ncbi:hypothetical protein ABZ354_13820 [Streptomyces sp. NPDC005925]|uniref:hypothetical protein n=1 Tax=Streptomyces sp. NPDC005925 TaxID=3157172 RepID=UPI0033E4227B
MNHGPDDQGPDEPGFEKREPADSGSETKREPAGHASAGRAPESLDESDGFGPDEAALRTLLHQVVQDVEPRDGTLDFLRRAVPARRARKRQAAVGMAAAALFVCTAVPALVHVSNSTGSDADPSAIGHTSQMQGGATQGKDPNGGSGIGTSAGQTEGTGQDGKTDETHNGGTDAGTGATEGADPSAGTAAGGAGLCTPDQLGASGSSEAPASTGGVQGTFRVVNVSAAACTVGGPGGVEALAGGAADQAKLGTQRHQAGDAAAGLPDPSAEAPALALEPGAAYEVKFAWVPSETCPSNGSGGTSGGDVDPTPDPTPTDEPVSGTSTGGDTGTSAQLITEDGMADGSVTVAYTSAAGAAASVVISNACAGTVYWTGVLAAE